MASTLVRSTFGGIEGGRQGEKSLHAQALGSRAQFSHPQGAFLLGLHVALRSYFLGLSSPNSLTATTLI